MFWNDTPRRHFVSRLDHEHAAARTGFTQTFNSADCATGVTHHDRFSALCQYGLYCALGYDDNFEEFSH